LEASASANGLDTITDFTVGTGNDVIDVDAFLGTVPSSLTANNVLTANTGIANDTIYTVDFNAAIAGKDFGGGDFSDLFATTGKAFSTTVSATTDNAVIVVQGTDETQIYYVDASSTTLTNSMVAEVATLSSVDNLDTFVATNFT